ncbi:MAG TPA: FAD-dependent oxidoreductase [Acidimicrobiales bacterium]|nr:FAD-dependent oxidoreductase [Acidimicrobiales bacterium]
MTSPAARALVDAAPAVFWLDRPDTPEPSPPLTGTAEADLAIVGGGYTGLWAARQALADDPGRDVLVLEAGTVALGASGRNGGFLSASVTHGAANGRAHFPDELATLHRLGNDNYDGLLRDLDALGIDAAFEPVGDLTVAVAPWQADELPEHAALLRDLGEDVEVLDGPAMQADVRSPTYLGGVWQRSHGGLVDPARLAWGLLAAVRRAGARVHEHSPVTGVGAGGRALVLRGPHLHVRARQVLLATNAFPGLVAPIRRAVVPVYDHVLVTEPLSDAQWASLGWRRRQGLSDGGNRFHYYRPTPDGRVLWGGWDALYHFGGGVGPEHEQDDRTARTLAEHFLATFPQLDGVRFTHRWGGPIATTSRFMFTAGTRFRGRLAWAVGYTGLGVGASRFGARVALDLLAGEPTERTRLTAVRRPPVPFPPEPLRWVAIAATRRALARADADGGRRGPWLRLLDRFGVGFDS